LLRVPSRTNFIKIEQSEIPRGKPRGIFVGGGKIIPTLIFLEITVSCEKSAHGMP
jgi:hypothetical protein